MDLTYIFLCLLGMSITASFAILAVLLVRVILSRIGAPKIFSYILWTAVLFRLVCPFGIESNFGFIPQSFDAAENALQIFENSSAKTAANDNYAAPADINNASGKDLQTDTNAVLSDINYHTQQSDNPDPAANNTDISGVEYGQPALPITKNSAHISVILTAIWLTVLTVLLAYTIISSVSLRRKLMHSYKVPYGKSIATNEVRTCDFIKSPFVFGFLHPKIYLPSGIAENETDYIILHEQTHIKRGDHIIKIAAFLVLCIHWFNPLVWLAFSLMSRDMEKSCDEKVIKLMGSEIKKPYSSSLLALSAAYSPQNAKTRRKINSFRLIGGTPLTFSENGVKGRIKNILSYKKPAMRTIIAASLIVTVSSALLACNPAAKDTGTMLGKTYDNIEECASDFVEDRISYHNSLGEYTIIDSEITSITPLVSITIEESENNNVSGTISAYKLSYKLKPDDISKVIFAGGMAEEDGWILGTESMGEPVLIVAESKSGPNKLTYMGNDYSGEFFSEPKGASEVSLRAFLENQNLINSMTFYSGEHKIAEFTASTGETWKLLLSQPASQGDGGIWCVERWMDGQGTVYYDYPNTELSLNEYYTKIQNTYNDTLGSAARVHPITGEEADVMIYEADGIETGGASPNYYMTALYYISHQLNHTYMQKDDITIIENASLDAFYTAPTNHFIGYISALTDEENYFHFDRVKINKNGDIYNSYIEVDYMETNSSTKYYLLDTSSSAQNTANSQNSAPVYKEVTREELRSYLDTFADSNESEYWKTETVMQSSMQRIIPLFNIETKLGFVTEIRETAK